jgi:hypothetical protein
MGQIIYVTSSNQKLEPKYGFQKKLQVPKESSFLALTFDGG